MDHFDQDETTPRPGWFSLRRLRRKLQRLRPLRLERDTAWTGPGELWHGTRPNLTELTFRIDDGGARILRIEVRLRQDGTGGSTVRQLERWLRHRGITRINGLARAAAVPFWRTLGYRVSPGQLFEKELPPRRRRRTGRAS
ncbi:hypothetical protein AW736_13685 [Termitidicoccus mucosus]|uniref:Uncharacterized protein n=2 Tax=Termitidicoccus mucosus TaxID=1184151 RepID=A0A178IHS0_9BACT|nr:hypothetical protein AW736_13685 [Opitutaceae bacterium TSB47]